MKKPRKSADTRDLLLDTAIRLISKSSYSNVGVAEICDCAGVTKGSFYHYFDSKAALFEAASDHYWEEKKRRLDAIFSPEHDALTRLEQWIDYAIEVQRKKADAVDDEVPGCPVFASSAQCTETEAAVREAGVRMGEKVMKYHAVLVKGLLDDGRLLHDCDPCQVGRMLTHYVQGLILYAQMMRNAAVIGRDIREGVYRLIGLKPEFWKKTLSAHAVDEPAPVLAAAH